MDQEHDQTPFLSNSHEDETEDTTTNTSRNTKICTAIFGLQLLTLTAYNIVELPTVRLLERNVCLRHYNDDHLDIKPQQIDESHCKIPSIQDELGYLLGVRVALNAVPCLLTSIVWARFSNRKGRKLTIGIGCSGELLGLLWVLLIGAFPTILSPRLSWLSASFLLLGGGIHFLISLFNTVLADIVTPEKRSRYMFLLFSLVHVSGLLAPPFGAFLMTINLWLPFAISIGLMCSRFLILSAMPDVLNQSKATTEASKRSTIGRTSQQMGLRLHSPTNVHTTILKFLSLPGLKFCFTAFLLKRIAFSSENLIYQYASEVLQKHLHEIVWIRVALGIGATTMTLIILPLSSRCMRHASTQFVNIWIVRISLTILIVGFLLMWSVAHTVQMGFALLLCGLGEGLEPALQALASVMVDKASNADLFAIFSVVDTIAKVIGGPLMASLLSIRDDEGVSVGACFLLSACLFFALWLLSWTLSWESMDSILAQKEESEAMGNLRRDSMFGPGESFRFESLPTLTSKAGISEVSTSHLHYKLFDV